MTAPRQVLPGATYLVTRRCAHRQFLLRPRRTTTDLFRYLLALAARRHHIRLHAFCALSNHYHLVLSDPLARLPAFLQLLDSLLARALNASLGRWEAFWAPASYSAVRLESPDDVLAKAAYTLANPVAAGLVRSGHLWPGLWSSPDLVGAGPVRARRPDLFFDPLGSLPLEVDLELSVPPGFASTDAFRSDLAAALDAAELAARRRHRTFLGAARVLAQRPTSRPADRERRRALNPRLASRDTWKRVEALSRLSAFLHAYRLARDAWGRGLRHVLFPHGTYLLRVFHGAPCLPGAG